MYLGRQFLSLLAAETVMASAKPETDHQNVSPRFFGQAGVLTSRVFNGAVNSKELWFDSIDFTDLSALAAPSCLPADLVYSSKVRRCVCRETGHYYDSAKKKCYLDCGSQATSQEGSCVCNQGGHTFDLSDKTCSPGCPSGTIAESGRCVCTDTSKELKDGSCQCKTGSVADDKGGCRPECPYGTTWTGSACRCDNDELELKSGECQCKITGSILNSKNKCVCPPSTMRSGNQCIDKCPPFAPWSDQENYCVCKDEGKAFDAQGASEGEICRCPGGMTFKTNSRYPEGACLKDCHLSILFFDIDLGVCQCENGGVLSSLGLSFCEL